MKRETLVLLPGMMCDQRLFGPQINAFQENYCVIIPELSQSTIKAMAEAVLNEVDDGSLNVAGLSMGGIVAMEMVAQQPDRIERLGLLDTNHHVDLPVRFDIRNRQIDDVRSGHLRDVIVDEMKPNYLAEANRSRQELLDLLIDMAMDLGADAFVAQSLALRDRPDQTQALKSFSGKTLVLCGEEDLLCPLERHREIAGLMQNAHLEVVPNAGHISTLEAPDDVNRALERWLLS